jgi:hypothetical protein
MSLHQNNKLLLVHEKRCFVSHWPPASELGMLLVTHFLELGMVAARGRKLASHQHAVSYRHPASTLPRPCHGLENSLSERHIRGMAGKWQGNGMGTVWERNGMCESNTGALCKSNGKDTI